MIKDNFTAAIIGMAFKVHNALGSGFLEKVYENALLIELRKAGFQCNQQHPISVWYEETLVGEYYADILIENKLIIELKALNNLLSIHEVQLVNYLNATKIDTGLLINFGPSVEIKRKHRQYKKGQ